MNISQRLTRAGLAFLLFGSIAAILPQQNSVAIADGTCTTDGHTFVIENSVGTASDMYPQVSGSSDTYTSYLDGSPSVGGSFTASGGDTVTKNTNNSATITAVTDAIETLTAVNGDYQSQVTVETTSGSSGPGH